MVNQYSSVRPTSISTMIYGFYSEIKRTTKDLGLDFENFHSLNDNHGLIIHVYECIHEIVDCLSSYKIFSCIYLIKRLRYFGNGQLIQLIAWDPF